MKKLIALVALAAIFISASAQDYKLEGKVGGKYPIVMELKKLDDGYVIGRYAYRSTLNKNGDTACSWLKIAPGYENPRTTWRINDCDGREQETWTKVRFDGSTLSARLTTEKGKVYDVAANVVSSKMLKTDLDEFYRSHLGDYPQEIAMFHYPAIVSRLKKMMGTSNFDYLVSIFDTQTPIEYNNGMYWSSGFVSHECCDPYAVWAYDTRTKSFYVWILRNQEEYWWAENGKVPYEFKELVKM